MPSAAASSSSAAAPACSAGASASSDALACSPSCASGGAGLPGVFPRALRSRPSRSPRARPAARPRGAALRKPTGRRPRAARTCRPARSAQCDRSEIGQPARRARSAPSSAPDPAPEPCTAKWSRMKSSTPCSRKVQGEPCRCCPRRTPRRSRSAASSRTARSSCGSLCESRPLRAAHQHVRRDPDAAQLVDRVLRRLGLQLAGVPDVGDEREVDEHTAPPPHVDRELADRLQERQRLDVPNSPADLGDHEVHVAELARSARCAA